MDQDNFTKLFKYLEDTRKEVNSRFDNQDEAIGDTRGAITELGLQIRDYHQEFMILANKIDRLEQWIHQIADKTGIKLTHS